MNDATTNNYGFKCPVRGCLKRQNRRFSSLGGLTKHLIDKHPDYLEKKLNVKKCYRDKSIVPD